MPIKMNREYRIMPLLQPAEEKRFDSDYYVEGFATTFNDPYVLWRNGEAEYKEIIDKKALDTADMSDIIMQYNHSGRVFARNKMGKNKTTTLIAEPQDSGFFIAADLSKTAEARSLYEDINEGLIFQMSWAFTVSEDEYDSDNHTRIIKRVDKVYDVSAVSTPANPSTDISARSYFEGVIEQEAQELCRREELVKQNLRALLLLKTRR